MDSYLGSWRMAGNRTERIRGAVHEQYLYDECNRLLQITDGADTVKNYTYDNSGNMLSDGEMSYLYDGFGRLEQVTKADGSFQKNHYDAEGLRAEMEENGQLVKFLYNEDREAVAEEESDGNVIRYIRGLGLISSDSEKAKTYYHYVSDEQGSITHVINGEEKESGELPQEDVQSRVLNHYEYDAFGNTIRCEEQVHNRFRYTGEQYDPLTGQYYLRARYYNPVIARFTQEDTYYGDGLNLYTYCQNNPVLYHDPTGHGTKENSPYSRKEQQYIDAGADPDTARLAAECYPDANSKQDLYNKYKSQGYNATDAKKLANYEIVHGEERAKNYAANNVKKSGSDYTATSPRENPNTDWRTQNRLNAQREAGAGKSGSNTTATERRNSPGVVEGNGRNTSKMMYGTDKNAGVIPKEIADKLREKQYNNFDEFRNDFWKAVAETDYANEFLINGDPKNYYRMKNGGAPLVVSNQAINGSFTYQLHHIIPINQGGSVYSVDNLVVVTPRYHAEILIPEVHGYNGFKQFFR